MEMIGKLISALSNAARIEQKDFAYVIWGIEDVSKKIIGTTFILKQKKLGTRFFCSGLPLCYSPE